MGPERRFVVHVQDVQVASRWYCYVLRFRVAAERFTLNGSLDEAELSRAGGPGLVLRRVEQRPQAADGRQARPFILSDDDDLGRVAERAAQVAEIRGAARPGPAAAPRAQLVLHDPDGHALVLFEPPPPR